MSDTESSCCLLSLDTDDIAINLETKITPQDVGVLERDDWEKIIKMRAFVTRPLKGKGGLDGKGRKRPALSYDYIKEVEELNPHLANSKVVDTAVWKDNVEQKFRSGSIARPKALTYPYPVLETRVMECGDVLTGLQSSNFIDIPNIIICLEAIDILCGLPMDVELLGSSGIGRIVRKSIKIFAKSHNVYFVEQAIPKLNKLLSSWKAMAGVTQETEMLSQGNERKPDDLTETRSCNSWKDLFYTLEEKSKQKKKPVKKDKKTLEISSKAKEKMLASPPTKKEADEKQSKVAKTVSKPSRKMKKLQKEQAVASALLAEDKLYVGQTKKKAERGVSRRAELSVGTASVASLKKKPSAQVNLIAAKTQVHQGKRKAEPTSFGLAVARMNAKSRKTTKRKSERAFVELGSRKRMKMPGQSRNTLKRYQPGGRASKAISDKSNENISAISNNANWGQRNKKNLSPWRG